MRVELVPDEMSVAARVRTCRYNSAPKRSTVERVHWLVGGGSEGRGVLVYLVFGFALISSRGKLRDISDEEFEEIR